MSRSRSRDISLGTPALIQAGDDAECSWWSGWFLDKPRVVESTADSRTPDFRHVLQ